MFWFKPLMMLRFLPYLRGAWWAVGKQRRSAIIGKVKPQYFIAAIGGLGGVVGWEVYNSRQEVPHTGRIRYMLVGESENDEVKSMVRLTIAEMLNLHPPIDALSSHVRRVKRIVMNLVNSCEELRNYKDGWKIHVLYDDSVNAFATPGGYICVNTGLLKEVNDDALAVVIGHELSHALLDHSIERMGFQGMKEIGSTSALLLLSYFFPDYIGFWRWETFHRSVLPYVTDMPYSRLHESEADWLGTQFAARAGYDAVKGATDFFSKKTDEDIPEWMSTHPSDEHRVANVNEIKDKLNGLRSVALTKPLRTRWSEWWAVEKVLQKERAQLVWQRKREIPLWIRAWVYRQMHTMSRTMYRTVNIPKAARRGSFFDTEGGHAELVQTMMEALAHVQSIVAAPPAESAS